MTPGEPALAAETVRPARTLPTGQGRYGIPSRGAYRLAEASAALPARTDGDDRAGWGAGHIAASCY
jgi:hypothetical protein